jgi:heme A synthase
MILTSIALALLALVAGMYLLDKTKKEGLGKFFNFIAWVVIVVSLLILLCGLTRGLIRMQCANRFESRMEMCRPGMMGDDCCMPMRGHHGRMMREECCDEMMGGKKMRGGCGDMEEDDDEMEGEMHKEIIINKDTAVKK